MRPFLLAAILAVLAGPASAVPGYEHRMEQACPATPISCGSCHEPMPALNQVGKDWKEGDWSSFQCPELGEDEIDRAQRKALEKELKDGLKADEKFRKAWLKGFYVFGSNVIDLHVLEMLLETGVVVTGEEVQN